MRNRDMQADYSSSTAGGLTKLEVAAIAAMQGCLSMGDNCQGSPEELAVHAIFCANALFDELEKE
jgi:hypothetical protein